MISSVRPASIASIRPTPPTCRMRVSSRRSAWASSMKNPAVAPRLWSAGRAPSGRVVTMEDDVANPSQRCISPVSTPKSPKRRSTQSPIRSWPTPPAACTLSPCFAATMAADPAAPETASAKSSTK